MNFKKTPKGDQSLISGLFEDRYRRFLDTLDRERTEHGMRTDQDLRWFINDRSRGDHVVVPIINEIKLNEHWERGGRNGPIGEK